MAIPGEPIIDAESGARLRDLLAKGYVGTLFLTTPDVHAEYEELKARGVEFNEPPTEQPWGVDYVVPRPVRQQHPPRAARRGSRERLMCLYGPPHLARDSIDTADGIADPAPGDDRHDLEIGEVLPFGDPRLQERHVVALHQLETAS